MSNHGGPRVITVAVLSGVSALYLLVGGAPLRLTASCGLCCVLSLSMRFLP